MLNSGSNSQYLGMVQPATQKKSQNRWLMNMMPCLIKPDLNYPGWKLSVLNIKKRCNRLLFTPINIGNYYKVNLFYLPSLESFFVCYLLTFISSLIFWQGSVQFNIILLFIHISYEDIHWNHTHINFFSNLFPKKHRNKYQTKKK